MRKSCDEEWSQQKKERPTWSLNVRLLHVTAARVKHVTLTDAMKQSSHNATKLLKRFQLFVKRLHVRASVLK